MTSKIAKFFQRKIENNEYVPVFKYYIFLDDSCVFKTNDRVECLSIHNRLIKKEPHFPYRIHVL